MFLILPSKRWRNSCSMVALFKRPAQSSIRPLINSQRIIFQLDISLDITQLFIVFLQVVLCFAKILPTQFMYLLNKPSNNRQFISKQNMSIKSQKLPRNLSKFSARDCCSRGVAISSESGTSTVSSYGLSIYLHI